MKSLLCLHIDLASKIIYLLVICTVFCLFLSQVLYTEIIIRSGPHHKVVLRGYTLGQAKLIHCLLSGIFKKYMRAGGHFSYFIKCNCFYKLLNYQ